MSSTNPLLKRIDAIAGVAGMLLLSCTLAAQADETVGRVSVIDGDTLDQHGKRIRLYGIDAPEHAQLCFDWAGNPWRCGQRSAFALADYVGGSPVTCVAVDTDSYQRTIARCAVRGSDLGEWLVREGWAMAYRRYSSAYVATEANAQSAHRGIWIGKVQPPWEWRRDHPR